MKFEREDKEKKMLEAENLTLRSRESILQWPISHVLNLLGLSTVLVLDYTYINK
jgi:hypothetical protein